MIHKTWAYCFLYLLILLMTGCVSNIRGFDSDVVCPVDYVFNASFEKTWDATVKAVLQLGTADEIDLEKGVITSGLATVNGEKTKTLDQAVFGQVYKYSYTIKLYPEDGNNKTHIITQVNLIYERFMGMQKREDRKTSVENHLRNTLYQEICNNLFSSGDGHCSQGFDNQQVYLPANTTPVPAVSIKKTPQFDSRVRDAQNILERNGYSPGPADGIMGQESRTALSHFQEDQGIAVTGTLDDETWHVLQNLDTSLSDTSSKNLQPDQPPSQEHTNKSKTQAVDAILTAKPEKAIAPTKNNPPQQKNKPTETGLFTTEITDLLENADLFGAEIINTIPAHTSLQVLSSDGEYFKVKYQGKEGYVYYESVEKK